MRTEVSFSIIVKLFLLAACLYTLWRYQEPSKKVAARVTASDQIIAGK